MRWGILGTGNIADKFVCDLAHVPDAVVYAVASRTFDKAKAFAKSHGVLHAYGSYRELCDDVNVDSVYVCSPHPMHLQDALLAINSGKHVLCEKPMTINTAQLDVMIQAAERNNVFLMEAFWTRFIPAPVYAQRRVASGELGHIISIQGTFGFPGSKDLTKRVLSAELGGGSLLDVGIYPLNQIMWMMCDGLGARLDDVAACAALHPKTAVDETCSVVLRFDTGCVATLTSSVSGSLDNRLVINGTAGTIELCTPINAPRVLLHRVGGPVHWTEQALCMDFPGRGYQFQATHFQRCVAQRLRESPVMSLAASRQIMKVMDQVRQLVNLTYPCERD